MTASPRAAARPGPAALAPLALAAALCVPTLPGQPPADGGWPSVSGVYPHLAVWNEQNECGIGAVEPWAGSLWFVTYAPHRPRGSDDKLYRVTPSLGIEPFAGSVGGTPASRMVHEESGQLFLGPYAVGRDGTVRVVRGLVGRLTGAARHLTDPADRIYLATMEEGLYEVDVRTLEWTELFADDQDQVRGGARDADGGQRLMELPGYHGKGLYTGQGRLVYANNGEPTAEARRRPDVPSGVLAEWSGGASPWRVVRRAQFTDVGGPGGLRGNAPDDPVWAIGWDHRSLILMLLDEGRWSSYRLPKASHTYDGAHGWNTEWPRFRDLGEEGVVSLNMHGMFWRFPSGFRREASGGIEPRSTYLKVVGDTTRWGDRLVFGCDDTARSEFLNRRRAKGALRGPGQSHSNLWFAPLDVLDRLGPPLGRGAVWLRDDVDAGAVSEPYLLGAADTARGFAHRGLWLAHGADTPRRFRLEADASGDGTWRTVASIEVPAGDLVLHDLDSASSAPWIRLVAESATPGATAFLHYRARDGRSAEGASAGARDATFAGLATPDAPAASRGRLLVRGGGQRTLAFAAAQADSDEPTTLYELDASLRLQRSGTPSALAEVVRSTAVPEAVLVADAASVLYVDDDGNRWRLPRARAGFPVPDRVRVDREVVTERDLFQCAGLFYELPARNAGGFARIRPITTHGLVVDDFASYRGLLVMSGVRADVATPALEDGGHVVRSDDGEAALWVGVVDDLWRAGKPVGVGGPWLDTRVEVGAPSDPYLMTGFDDKVLRLAHDADAPVRFTAEVDVSGDGAWHTYRTFDVPAGTAAREHVFPDAFGAYWIRFRVDRAARVTAQLHYR